MTHTQIWCSAQLILFAFFVFSPEFWAKYSALEVMIDVRDILTDRNLHHLVVNIYCPTPIFIAWNNWLPCGKHLHCWHSWFLGQKSSALGENSSHSQPAEGTRWYLKERAAWRRYKEIYKGRIKWSQFDFQYFYSFCSERLLSIHNHNHYAEEYLKRSQLFLTRSNC